MTMSKDHVDAAVDAQGQESSSVAMADTAMPGAPLVEHVEHQGCDLLETSAVEAVRGRLLELICGTKRQRS